MPSKGSKVRLGSFQLENRLSKQQILLNDSQKQINHRNLYTYNIKMKLALLLLLLAVSAASLESIDEEQLSQELNSNRQIWLVYKSQSNENGDVVDKVSRVLKGFFRVASINSGSESLSLYGDDRENPISYNGEFISDKIISWVLSELDKIIAERSQEARSLKAFQEYQEREKERANKEWKDEEELRKKSNTLLLSYDNWESAFLKSREPFLINFYEANNTACIDLNREWELLSTELKGKLKVAKINITETQNHLLQDQLKLSKYPSIRFYKNGPKKVEDFAQYEGINKKFSILEWVNARLAQKATQADIAVLNKENYETLCKSTKNTCIIVFLDDNQDQGITSQIEKLALDHIKKPITFLISKKGEQDAFAKQAGVTSYPDTVMVYCKLKKIWHMEGLDLQAIEDGINEISLGNRNNFVRLAFTENIV